MEIPAMWEVETGGWWFQASPEKMLARPYVKDKDKQGCVLIPAIREAVGGQSKQVRVRLI
jgi:hypothetical protein